MTNPTADDVLLRTAQRNLRTYIKSATWKCQADKEAALACLDVYDEDFAKMSVRLVNALADTRTNPPPVAEVTAYEQGRACCEGGPQWGHARDCPTLP